MFLLPPPFPALLSFFLGLRYAGIVDAAFSSIAFYEAETAEANLALLGERLPGALWAALPSLLAQVPDPDNALNYLERYLRDVRRPTVEYLEKNPAALHYLLLIFSYSHFLSESLVQQSDLIVWLHRRTPDEALEQIKSRDDLLEQLARFEATAFDRPLAVVLARFKRREYMRITVRDVLGLATLAETALELSHLADVFLERALRACEQKLTNAYGAPQFSDSAGRLQTVRMTILSLGKLGGEELNYSSDIDLMFLYEHDGQTAGGSAGAISNAEFFVRLAQAVLKLITEATPEGAVFRVDLRLRPEGQQGDLALSLAAALDYYRNRAREWELQMLIKARPSAGDVDAGRRFLRAVQPLIYRQELNLGAVEAVLNAREEMSRELRRAPGRKREHRAAWNVKLTPGGIRDIEFLTQCLQRLYGGTDMWLAAAGAGSTLLALQRLHDKGYITGRDFFRLGTAYQFLRKVEHRLQLREGLQRHAIPESREALDRLARRCGIEPAPGRTAGEQLLQRIGQHFAEVREIYERILRGNVRQTVPWPQPLEPGDTVDAGLAPLLPRLRSEFPAVANALMEVRAAGDAPARRGLDQFLSSALLAPALMRELEAHPEWIATAGTLFDRSDLAAEMLSRHPEEIRLAVDAAPVSQASTIEPPPASRSPSPSVSFEDAMAALRIAQRRATLRAVVRALLGEATPFDTFATLSHLAEESIQGALQLAVREFAAEDDRAAKKDPGFTNLDASPFAIVALGRLGTSEMDIGSDVDLIFVVEDGTSADSRERWRRIAERFVHVVSSHTREGLLFPVDTRLRARGAEGEMVQSAAYLQDYFRSEGEGWEAATFLKARPVAGNRAVACAAIENVRAILAGRFGNLPGQGGSDGARILARQLAHTKERLEKEASGSPTKGGFRASAGGYYDIEYILAFLTLTRALAPRASEGPGHILRQIAAVESAGALDPSPAQTLRSAALLYRSLAHALRLVSGRPSGHLPEPAQATRVVRLLKEWRVPLAGTLEETMEAAKRDVRAVYEQTILAAGA
jgi:glutamate-ammonia-ligase adenylyltransferase